MRTPVSPKRNRTGEPASGAVGVEIRLSGKLPGARAKSWRVAGGYLRKCGDAAITFVNKCILSAQLKPGVIGIQVRIMPPGVIMPDEIKLKDEIVAPAPAESAVETVVVAAEAAAEVEVAAGAEVKAGAAEQKQEEAKPAKKARAPRKKPSAEKVEQKPEEENEVGKGA